MFVGKNAKLSLKEMQEIKAELAKLESHLISISLEISKLHVEKPKEEPEEKKSPFIDRNGLYSLKHFKTRQFNEGEDDQ